HCNYNGFIANQCTFYPPRYELQPQTGNLNFLGRYTKELAGGWQAVLTGSMFRSEAEQIGRYELADAPDRGEMLGGAVMPARGAALEAALKTREGLLEYHVEHAGNRV